MPIYEYYCSDCGTLFETMRSMSQADDPIACESCDSEQTSRTISLVNAHSGGRVVAGGNVGCTTCSTHTCSTCGVAGH